jgi:uroporphyrinogen-III decarboxylase
VWKLQYQRHFELCHAATNHVWHNLEVFSKGRGFVFNAVLNIMPDVPPENVVAVFDAVKEFGN